MMADRKTSKRREVFTLKTRLLIWALALASAYLLILLLSLTSDYIPLGEELSKSDWLVFTGSYLAFAGTVLVSIASLNQAQEFRKQNEMESAARRFLDIQPAFIISPLASLDDKRFRQNNDSAPALTIKNVGKYPALNVYIQNEGAYLHSHLGPSDSIVVTTAATPSPSNCPCCNFPKELRIQYDDVDGSILTKSFTLDHWGNTPRYILTSTQLEADSEASGLREFLGIFEERR